MSDTRQTAYFPVIDTTGRRIDESVIIDIRPGIGVSGPNGEHLDRANGPHVVPLGFAAPLLSSHRARRVTAEEAEAIRAERAPAQDEKKEKEEEKDERGESSGGPVRGAPAGVQHRDPRPKGR